MCERVCVRARTCVYRVCRSRPRPVGEQQICGVRASGFGEARMPISRVMLGKPPRFPESQVACLHSEGVSRGAVVGLHEL